MVHARMDSSFCPRAFCTIGRRHLVALQLLAVTVATARGGVVQDANVHAEDYYARLGLNGDATPQDVAKHYRKLAMHWCAAGAADCCRARVRKTTCLTQCSASSLRRSQRITTMRACAAAALSKRAGRAGTPTRMTRRGLRMHSGASRRRMKF